MIKILNKQRQPVVILENAYKISYEKRLNEIWGVSFCLPLSDPKNAECKPLNFVEVTDDMTGEYIGLYRIAPSQTTKDESEDEVLYECDHVLSTLMDNVLFRYHETTNLPTSEVIQFLLEKQTVKHWRLGHCDFKRYFSYSWENESGLLAPLFSIAEPFDVPYQWTFDTTSYPWTLNLVVPESEATCELRYGKNLAIIERTVDPTNIVNRIYPLGSGEGVNQLTIEKVNGDIPYLEDATSIQKYGVLPYVWVDRRYTRPGEMKASAQALLKEWSVPKISYRVKAVDLSVLTGVSIDQLKVGKVVRIIDPDFGVIEARIVSEKKGDIAGAPDDIELDIANKTEDMGGTAADIQRRQEVNEVYSQGATNLLAYSYNDNADADYPAVIRFYLPDDLVRVNQLLLTFETTNFRAYSKAAISTAAKTATSSSGGGTTVSSSSGGGSVVSSSSGGGTTVSSSAGGGTTATSSTSKFMEILTGVPENSVGDPNDNYGYHLHMLSIPGHNHSVTIAPHSHSVTVANHSHSVTLPAHSHSVTIAAHSHNVEIPGHGHDLLYGVYEHDTLPSQVTIKVDGRAVPGTATSGDNIDLIPFLAKDSDGKVRRGAWHTVELTPNGLARINAQVISRLFIQSRTGGNY
ncbi:phage tail spike protein [Bacillus massilinigeriensis]|uniref:phage tail spike protein n=1 Tax=Bacillus mediterraneensis TaxID=1805474 RepID=UPI0008F7FBA3|nr:phage tail spike protein [Bacillus mediterraneensis]